MNNQLKEKYLAKVSGGRSLYFDELDKLAEFENKYGPIIESLPQEEQDMLLKKYGDYLWYIESLPEGSEPELFDFNKDYSIK